MEGKLILIVFTVLVAVAQADECVLYPYGTSEGDSMQDSTDDNSYLMTTTTSVPFMGRAFTKIYALTNGMISFGSGFTTYKQSSINLPSDKAHVANFFLDHDFPDGADGKLFYRMVTSADAGWSDLASLASCDAGRIGEDITPTVIVVVTWYKAEAYFHPSSTDPMSTFQAVLMSDGTKTAVVFNYAEINYDTDYWLQYPAVHIDSGSGTVEEFPFTKTNYAKTEMMKSNVNINGRIVFRVDQASPELPSVTSGDTCPPEVCDSCVGDDCPCVGDDCACVVDRDSGDTTTYDGALLSGILMKADSKIILSKQSQENVVDQTDTCKFQLRAVTDATGAMEWIGWSMGIHPKSDTKYKRNFEMKADSNNASYCSIQNKGHQGTGVITTLTEDEEVTETFTERNSGLDVKIEYLSGGGCELTSTACDYVLQYRPGDSVNQLSLRLGAAYDDKPLIGICQNKNGDLVDDDADCGYGNPDYTFISPSTVAEIRDNCACARTDKTCLKNHIRL